MKPNGNGNGKYNRRRKTDLVAAVVSIIAGACAIGALAFSLKSHSGDVEHIARSGRVAAYDNRLTALLQCQSSNEFRQSTIKFVVDFANEQKLLLLGPRSLKSDPERAQADRARQVLKTYVRRFQESAIHIARAVPSNEAQFPKAKDPEIRALRNCTKLYPLPPTRGDILPNPAVR